MNCRQACVGRERWRADSGSGPDTPQTPEYTLPRTQSSGVLEVHGTVVIGPEPEQLIDGSIIHRRRHGKFAEFPGVHIEGKIYAS